MAKLKIKICQTRLITLLALILIIAMCMVNAQQTNIIKIQNTAQISTTKIWAKSGTAEDIQAAVDAVAAAGGGTVYVPAGNFTFNITASTKRDPAGYPCGVLIPGGVNVIGAGNNQTILYTPINCWESTVDENIKNVMFAIDGRNGKPSRISGIYFQGSVNPEAPHSDDYPGLDGIRVYGGKDVRIDHCVFIDFCSYAIKVTNNYCEWNWWNKGVIDHCVIDNPYKDWFLNVTGRRPLWAYGIDVGNSHSDWNPNWDDFFGKYDEIRHVWYIEDCSLARCRHALSSASHSFYVVRHCTLYDMIVAGYGSYIDTHGTSAGFEAYNNTIINTPMDYRSTNDSLYWGRYYGAGIAPRGGFGLIFNNTIKYFSEGTAIKLCNDQTNETYRLNGFWIWNNTLIDVKTPLGTDPGSFTIDENDEYFLYAKPGYTPYPYPHPLTLLT
jgi:hypothetical protein